MKVKAPRDKPYAELCKFAAALGWPRLRCWQHTIKDDPNRAAPYTVTWYESGKSNGLRDDLFLQLNEQPLGQTTRYAGAVYAMRYRICTGFHPFRLPTSDRDFAKQLLRVACWLKRDWFDSLAKRREFRAQHPECCGYSWRKIREQGLPH